MVLLMGWWFLSLSEEDCCGLQSGRVKQSKELAEHPWSLGYHGDGDRRWQTETRLLNVTQWCRHRSSGQVRGSGRTHNLQREHRGLATVCGEARSENQLFVCWIQIIQEWTLVDKRKLFWTQHLVVGFGLVTLGNVSASLEIKTGRNVEWINWFVSVLHIICT